MHPLIAALMNAQQPAQPQASPMAPASPLIAAMARGKGKGKGDAKYRMLPALPKHGEAQHADSKGGTNGQSNASANGAFQSDSFQGDTFQI